MNWDNVSYYHGQMTRPSAEKLLDGRPFGSFLLRKSYRDDDSYAISVALGERIVHYAVEKDEQTQLYSVSHGSGHSSPVLVCEHYMQEAGGLKTKLLYPVACPQTHSIRSIPGGDVVPLNKGKMSFEEADWFHGVISREEDTKRLSNTYHLNKENGIFLIREKEDDKFVLSLVHMEKVHRYIINRDSKTNLFFINEKEKNVYFKSLEELIEFHKLNPPEVTGLQCQLSSPCYRSLVSADDANTWKERQKPSESGIISSFKNLALNLASEFKTFLPVDSLDRSWSETNTNESAKYENDVLPIPRNRSSLKSFSRMSMPKDSIGFYSPYRNCVSVSSQDHCTAIVPDLYISQNKVNLLDVLGAGHFGCVRLAECSILGKVIPCAVKILSGNDIQANRDELLKEAVVMQGLDHPYIVRLLAVCDPKVDESNLMLVIELAPMGTLKNFIKQHNELTFPESRILILMNQVCDGMAYLSHHNIIHRDLAARNVLLVSENFAKISDFGMSRILHHSESYYKASKPGSWPLRWYAPEALLYYKFTSKGDVWSFGITVWEVCSYGSRPYKGMKGRDILQMLENDKRLECPNGCSPGVYSMLLQCWIYEPEERPSFQKLLYQFEKLLK